MSKNSNISSTPAGKNSGGGGFVNLSHPSQPDQEADEKEIRSRLLAKPVTAYCDNPHIRLLCQGYGVYLQGIPPHDKFAILQLIGAIGSAYTDPRLTGEYNDESPYQCENAHQDHSIWLDTDEETIWDILDKLNRSELLGLAQFLTIDLATQ